MRAGPWESLSPCEPDTDRLSSSPPSVGRVLSRPRRSSPRGMQTEAQEGGATNQCALATKFTLKISMYEGNCDFNPALTNAQFPRVLFAHSNLDSTHRARIDPSS